MCVSVMAFEERRLVDERIIQSKCESNMFVSCSFFDMYAKCKIFEDVQQVFNKMPKLIDIQFTTNQNYLLMNILALFDY